MGFGMARRAPARLVVVSNCSSRRSRPSPATGCGGRPGPATEPEPEADAPRLEPEPVRMAVETSGDRPHHTSTEPRAARHTAGRSAFSVRSADPLANNPQQVERDRLQPPLRVESGLVRVSESARTGDSRQTRAHQIGEPGAGQPAGRRVHVPRATSVSSTSRSDAVGRRPPACGEMAVTAPTSPSQLLRPKVGSPTVRAAQPRAVAAPRTGGHRSSPPARPPDAGAHGPPRAAREHGQPHAVEVALDRRVGGVEVGVGVEHNDRRIPGSAKPVTMPTPGEAAARQDHGELAVGDRLPHPARRPARMS